MRRKTEAIGAGIREVLLEPFHGDRLAGKPCRLRKCCVEHIGVEFRDIGIAEQKDIVVLDIEPTEREIGRAGRDRKRHRGVAAFAARYDDFVVLQP